MLTPSTGTGTGTGTGTSLPAKAQIEDDVNAAIADRAQARTDLRDDDRRIERAAGAFRDHAVDAVVTTEREERRSRGLARASQVIDYAFFLIYALLGIRFLLALIAARSTAGFVQLIVTVSNPFYAPFRNIVDSPRTEQGHTLLVPVLVALAAYIVLHLAIDRLLRLIAVRKTEL